MSVSYTHLDVYKRQHVDHIIVHHKVASLNQFDAHLPGEKCVLEVRRIVISRSQQNDGGPALRGQRTKRGEQRLAILLDGPHSRCV